MRILYPMAFVLAGALVSCHRDTPLAAPTYDLSGRYSATGLMRATPIRMFVRQAELNNPALLARFLARRPWLAGYFSATDVPPTATIQLKLRFWGSNRATITNYSAAGIDSVQAEVSDQLADSFRLQRLDSASMLTTSNTSACARLQGLGDYLTQALPGQRCQKVSPATGYDSYCRVRNVSMIGAHDTELYLPYFSWCVTSAGCTAAVGGLRNLFNSAGLSQLTAGDTLVVQVREIPLSR